MTASTESWGLREVDRAGEPARGRAAAAADRAGRPPAPARRASAPSWCWPPTSSSSRRARARATRPGARAEGDERAHRHRRLSLVHRLGPRHDDQPRGADAGHRPPRRGARHPAHLRAPRPRRPDPEPVPRGRDARACITPPTRRCGSSTRSIATSSAPATARRCRLLLPTLRDIVEQHLAGTRFGIGVDPADGLLRQGARRLPAHLDGRQGRRLGRDAAPRQGGRDQRALVQRAAAAGALAASRPSTATTRPRGADAGVVRARRRAARVVQPRASGTQAAATCTTSSTARAAATTPACRPNQVLAISLPHPVLDRARWPPVLDVVRERLLTPFGLRSLAPGHPDYKPRYDGDLRARDAAYHQGTVWALADRPVRRRLAAGVPRRPRRRAPLARRASNRSSAKPASARSARSSTPSRRSRRAAASPRPGASPRRCARFA